jgi:hypothetical protein
MVKIYTCQACTENRHKDCELSKPSYPPGSYGGSRCLCSCNGNPHFNDPDVIHRELMKQLDKITKFDEESMKESKKSKLVVKNVEPPSFIEEVKRLRRKIECFEDDIEDIQNKCKHSFVEKTYRGNTGNYDRYWTEFYCPLCDKSWVEEGSV